MSRRTRVTVKLLEDVVDETTGDLLWAKDAVLKVDPGSAAVYVETKVAVVVEPEKAEEVDAPVAKVTEASKAGPSGPVVVGR